MIQLPEELIGLPYIVDPATGIISLLGAIPVSRMASQWQSIDGERVRLYATAMARGAHFPPVDLFGPRWPMDSYALYNGHHRREAAIRTGVSRLLAWVTPVHRRPHDPPAWWASVRREEVDEALLGPQWAGFSDETPSSSAHEDILYDLLLRHACSPEETSWESVLQGVIQIALQEGGLHPGWAEEMIWAGMPIPRHLTVGMRSRAQEAVLRPGFTFRARVRKGGQVVWVAPTGEVWAFADHGSIKQRGVRWQVIDQRTGLVGNQAHGVRTVVLTP